MTEKKFRSIQETGYSELLNIFSRYPGAERGELRAGAGESSAILESSLLQDPESVLLETSGIFLEGVHFDLSYTPLQHLGYKLLSSVASRIYAMNGEPVSVQIDLAVPNKVSVEMAEKLFEGLGKAASECNCALTPRDITASGRGLVASLHITGVARGEQLVTRGGCKPGEPVCVSGDLGGAMAGLRILLKEKKAWVDSGHEIFHPDLEEYSYVIQRQLMPRARADAGKAFAASGVRPTSMIELGRGLLNEIQLLTDASGTGCEIFVPAVPIALETRRVADEMKEDVDRYACYGGEDYELLFTLKSDEDVEKLKEVFDDFSVIGEIRDPEKGIVLNTGDGSGPVAGSVN